MYYSDKEVDSVVKGIAQLANGLRQRGFSNEQIAQVLMTSVSLELSKMADGVESERMAPLSIFVNDVLGSLECVVKFLKENKGLSLPSIAKRVGRTTAAVSSTYASAVKKMPRRIVVKTSEYEVSPSIFQNRKLSVLENLVLELKRKYVLRNVDIARLLGRDSRTIWTVISRAKARGVRV